jgi:hypothetical protein
MTHAPTLNRRDMLRGGLGHLADLAEAPLTALAALDPDDPEDGVAPEPTPEPIDPVEAFFGSFESCHTLLAEIRPLLDEEVARLGIDPRGKEPLDLAREIFSRQERPPVPARDPDPPPARQDGKEDRS